MHAKPVLQWARALPTSLSDMSGGSQPRSARFCKTRQNHFLQLKAPGEKHCPPAGSEGVFGQWWTVPFVFLKFPRGRCLRDEVNNAITSQFGCFLFLTGFCAVQQPWHRCAGLCARVCSCPPDCRPWFHSTHHGITATCSWTAGVLEFFPICSFFHLSFWRLSLKKAKRAADPPRGRLSGI